MKLTIISIYFFLFCVFTFELGAQSLSEKLQVTHHEEDDFITNQPSLKQTQEVLLNMREQLRRLHEKAWEAHCVGEDSATLVEEIQTLKNQLEQKEKEWKQCASQDEQDPYGLWSQSNATVETLVLDYGANDSVYLIPPDIRSLPITLASHLPIPREAWNSLVEIILTQNGIGIRQLSPFLKELYLIDKNPARAELVTHKRSDLELFPDATPCIFHLRTHHMDRQTLQQFLQHFSGSPQLVLKTIGNEVFAIGSVQDIKQLVRLFDFIQSQQEVRNYKIMRLEKMDAKSMQEILEGILEIPKEQVQQMTPLFKVFILPQSPRSLFLLGNEDEIARAEKIVKDIEGQMDVGKEKIVYWYNVKHSEPEEVAKVLSGIYRLLANKGENSDSSALSHGESKEETLLVNPSAIEFTEKLKKVGAFGKDQNFIVDSKTGAILMVVEEDILPKLKHVLRKIDVPKKMVRIEVLLFEKREIDETRFGLNVLKIGTGSGLQKSTSLVFNDVATTPSNIPSQIFSGPNHGLLSFSASRLKGRHLPAFDLTYNFLLANENVQINANPSVVTVNQTPAAINLVDEVSINTGSEVVPTGGAPVVVDSFERKQYGIRIKMTPTIHEAFDELCEDASNEQFITLKTDIVFDTTLSDANNRPTVFRRQIQNEVRIADGQTIILGGLRRKYKVDKRETLPFLGEIPGFGKLFSDTTIAETSTEMFVFITPKIVDDPKEDFERVQMEQLKLRPGDIPEFLDRIEQAKKEKQRKTISLGLQRIFGA